MFTSYNSAANYMSRARNKRVGRQLTSRLRVCELADGEIVVTHDAVRLCVIRPDDTVHFVMPDTVVASFGNSLVQHIHKFLPAVLKRKGRGVYEFLVRNPPDSTDSGDYSYGCSLSTHGYKFEYFEGITFKFDNNSLTCVNPKMPLTKRIDVEKRLEWRRTLRHFKRQITLRAKLGVFDALIPKAADATTRVYYPGAPDTVDVLYEAIKSGEVTTEFLTHMIRRIRHNMYWTSIPPSGAQVAAHILSMCTSTYSVPLRKKFGVFQGES